MILLMMNVKDFTPISQPPLNLPEVRSLLEDERTRLVKQLHRAADQGRDGFDHNPDPFDLANSFTTLVERSALQTIDQKKLSQIEATLQRLNDGLYGYCVGCGDRIAAERLAILPATTHCVDCQQQTTA